jgi:hypothetical protein
VDVQPLLDKIGGRLPDWKGKLLSMAGRETLVKCVLTSQPVYHLTVVPMQKWLLKQIDKMRRSFLLKAGQFGLTRNDRIFEHIAASTERSKIFFKKPFAMMLYISYFSYLSISIYKE